MQKNNDPHIEMLDKLIKEHEIIIQEEKKLMRNQFGYPDPTGYKAVKNMYESDKKLTELIDNIYNLCNKYGFYIEERIVLRDKNTGRVYR